MRGMIGITITSYFLDPLFDRHDPLGFTAEGVLLCQKIVVMIQRPESIKESMTCSRRIESAALNKASSAFSTI